ncbi:gluconokinase [Neorhizobium sp. S3-V5DH]|uniref:gluconokinase n=1 Tax=Neorhizobium sp. S3-V5DH TaxID=2485166 RepID=UPI001050B3EC|nr:gluconokinase [Neorhizobium sp. S3-V5DH]TCV65920.1 gluconate kinase (SKI family) [Neorhizobium sp. S3-V5DH]
MMVVPQMHKIPVIVMGVSGCGKTSVARLVAARLQQRLVEGDELHSVTNIAKMTAGTPLTDSDRAAWLETIGRALASNSRDPPVVTCSALKAQYRDQLRSLAGNGVTFLYLRISHEEAKQRLAGRVGHFMPATLIESQFQTLEDPSAENDVITIDAGTPERVVEQFMTILSGENRPVAQ